MNWLDILLLFIIAWSAWRGLATGLFAGVARLAGLVLGAAFAYNYYLPLAEYADRQWHLESKIGDWLPLPSAGETSVEKIFTGLEKGYQAPGKLMSPDVFGQHSFSGVQNLSNIFSHGILEIAAFLVIFFVVAQLTCWVGLLFSKTAKLVFLGPVDRLGGLALGTLRGVIIVLVLLALVVPLEMPAYSSSGGHAAGWLAQAIEHSRIVPIFWQFLLKLKMIFPGMPLKTV